LRFSSMKVSAACLEGLKGAAATTTFLKLPRQ
jgi:hypothetical protein